MLAKHHVPAELESFLLQIFEQLCLYERVTFSASPRPSSVLQRALASDALAQPSDTDDTDPDVELFIEEFTHFTHVMVANHIQRVERVAPTLVAPFLDLFCQFTSVQTDAEHFLSVPARLVAVD